MPSQYYLNSVFPQNHEATLQPQPYHTTLLPYSGNAAILPQWYQTTKMLSYHLSHITPPPWYNNTTLLPNCDAKSYYHALQWPSPSQKHTVTHSYATPFNPTHSSTDHPAPLCALAVASAGELSVPISCFCYIYCYHHHYHYTHHCHHMTITVSIGILIIAIIIITTLLIIFSITIIVSVFCRGGKGGSPLCLKRKYAQVGRNDWQCDHKAEGARGEYEKIKIYLPRFLAS